jgi:hypothetical protein
MKMINTPRITSGASDLNLSSACKWFSGFMAVAVISVCLANSAAGQFVTPLAPAVGDGSIPKPEIAGDNLPSPPVISGKAQTAPIGGTDLSHRVNLGRTTIYIYSNCTRGTDDLMAGTRLVLTLRPASLMSAQVSDIGNILGINLNSGQAVIQATATAHQLELIQSVLNPSPNDSQIGLASINQNLAKQINKAPTAEQWSRLRRTGDDSLYIGGGVLPTARVCARYFVMAAVALSTVFLIFAASSIIFGQAHGGPRVIATCGGLMLLLMGFTIYKVALINLFNAKGTIHQNADIIKHFSNQGQVSVIIKKLGSA